MEQERKKYDSRAVLGTILFHSALLLVFILFGLTTPLPLPEEAGVMVSLGVTDQGMGQRQPLNATPAPPQPQPVQNAAPQQRVVTQNTEETVAIPEPRPTRPRQQTPTTQPQQTPTPPAQTTPQPDPQPTVDQRALFPGRDRTSTTNQDQGQTGQPGNQGRPDGTPGGTSTTGGGQGGVEFSLSGRRQISLPLPEYTSSSQGKVVVRITVNRNGEVVRAVAGERGTTTTDAVLWAAAERAAMRARFDVKNDAAEEQTGSITYNFIRN